MSAILPRRGSNRWNPAPCTRAVTLHLATVATLVDGLGLLGLRCRWARPSTPRLRAPATVVPSCRRSPLAQHGTACAATEDKNWLVVDNAPASPHHGRLYQFWTRFFANANKGTFRSAQQVLRYSDDHGATWSPIQQVTDVRGASTQDSQPFVLPAGTLVDTYQDRDGLPDQRIVSTVSRDGGHTWSPPVVVAPGYSYGPPDVRCCLASATADPVTGTGYLAWLNDRPDGGQDVMLSRTTDGQAWTAPLAVNHDPAPAEEKVNVDVAAYGGRVFAAYGLRNPAAQAGRYVQYVVEESSDRGASFGQPVSLGPPSDLAYAAQARGLFPGDYMGTAAGPGIVYAVFALSQPPAPDSGARYNQSLWGAVIAP